uniref:Cilia- and flagella-associated protein 91 n=1 Tax=Glossina palpalis gambiensis TaxID=67801 RepID=A0A1B0BRI8_9MUSC
MPSSKERFKCKASIKTKQSKYEDNSNLNEALSISSCSIGSDLFNNYVCDEEYHKKWRADNSTNSESNISFCTNNNSNKRSRLSGESSAQTLPYLPGISNDPQSILDMELFKLPTILPGDGPPGLYEVEVLERARKRWTFLKALKEKVRRQKKASREQAQQIIPKHILTAFEWEHWIEREECIEECQMARSEILARMFNKRESSMRSASNKSIEISYERIQNKKKAALRKNKLDHDRAVRMLSIKRSKESHVWRKENVSYDLDNPSSEYYAPKMRYGVNPNRRHYKALRKDFDIRMEDLEKQVVKMDPKDLKCPLAKIKALSKPKEMLSEHERNFCSDVNLKKLYESLKLLRTITGQRNQDTEYRVLRAGDSDEGVDDDIMDETKSLNDGIDTVKPNVALSNEVTITHNQSAEEATLESMYEAAKQMQYREELKREKELDKINMNKINVELLREEKENVHHMYEGLTIGWLMRFLAQEMERAQEQRRLHFYYMLAQRERWRREALEAGLRQKENCLRSHYEKLYKQCSIANADVVQSYLNEIMNEDIVCHAEQEAEEHIVKVAKEIDKDVDSWLQSFKGYQSPLDYDVIRCNIRRNIMSVLSELQSRQERNKMVDYIIEEVLFVNVFAKLDAHDICTVTTEELIDRLLDTDLYYESSESSSDDGDRLAEQEARSIMRKLVRYSVPGRRYLTPSERTVANNVDDILDVVMDKLKSHISAEQTETPVMQSMASLSLIGIDFPVKKSRRASSISQGRLSELETGTWHSDVEKFVNFTKELDREEELLLEDPDQISLDRMVVNVIDYSIPSDQIDFRTVSVARAIPNTHDMQLYKSFSEIPTRTYVEDSEPGRISDVEVELYAFLPVTKEIEEEEKEIEEEEKSIEDEESQSDKPVAAEESQENVSQVHASANPATQKIQASFDWRLPSHARASRKTPLTYKEPLPVKRSYDKTENTKRKTTSSQSKREGNLSINEALSISSCSIESCFFKNGICDEEYHKRWRADNSTNSESDSFCTNNSNKRSRLSGGIDSKCSCKFKKLDSKSPKVNVIDLKLGDAYSRVSIEYFKPPELKRSHRKTRMYLFCPLQLLRKTTEQRNKDTEYLILRAGDSDEGVDDEIINETKSLNDGINTIKLNVTLPNEVAVTHNQSAEQATLESMYEAPKQTQYHEELKREKELNKINMDKLNVELLREEKENVHHVYEGLTIGWLMRFLAEEMERAQEQRRLHFYYMLAQRERWRREALEAGLRQKENCLRSHYETLYKQCSIANTAVVQSYLNEIMNEDIVCYADHEAEEHVVKLAKQIDKDVDSWLQCFKAHQRPLDYDVIRCNLRRNIMSDLSELQCRQESNKVVDYIIEEVLFVNVFAKLDTHDICTVTTKEFIDRLLDTDLYYESTITSSMGEDRLAEQEARSIMRKLVRYSVPGRRYLTPSERTVANNVDDILDVVMDKLKSHISAEQTETPVMQSMASMSLIGIDFPVKKSRRASSIPQGRLGELETGSWHSDVEEVITCTKELNREEELLLEDPDKISLDRMVVNIIDYSIPSDEIEDFRNVSVARAIPSTHDMQLYKSFSDIPKRTYVEDTERGRISDVEVELYPFLPIKSEEEGQNVEEDEIVRGEEYIEEEELQTDKIVAAEESRQSVNLSLHQPRTTLPTQGIEASFLLRPSTALSRTSQKPRSIYKESVTLKKPTLSTKGRPTSAEDMKKKTSSTVTFSQNVCVVNLCVECQTAHAWGRMHYGSVSTNDLSQILSNVRRCNKPLRGIRALSRLTTAPTFSTQPKERENQKILINPRRNVAFEPAKDLQDIVISDGLDTA